MSGLVNYSDDDSSSSGDEQPEVYEILRKNVENKPVFKQTTKDAKPTTKDTKSPTSLNAAIAAVIPNIIKQPVSGEINEYHKKLMAALAPKPIERVDNWGIPDEPTTPCDPERAERIAHFLSLRASGHRLNDHLQHNKAFRNPRIYARLVEFTDVEELGSNFDKQDFDPTGFPSELYIDGILETQKKLAEEKQQNSAMAQAMATAAKVASRIAKPPIQEEKRKSQWEDGGRESKRR
ncbi:hypothetical protein INT48_004169 [Thamnidium elegans]|uniref:HCNGP-domain-containing protein n=1 Tax=Thamnidium elegans TaxID=101142 RepID=A0A8H7STC3_9FUNG|nr:hypothetical protein INT48_004169 [Thamnidium elegans]